MDPRTVHRACTLLAAILWTMSATTMGLALDGSPDQIAELSQLLALVALVPTAHLVIEYTVVRSRAALLADLDKMIGRHRSELVEAVLEVIGRADAGREIPRIGERR